MGLVSLLEEFPAWFEPTECPLLGFLEFLFQIDLLFEQKFLLGSILGLLDDPIKMGLQETIQFLSDLKTPLLDLGYNVGNRLAGALLFFGPLGHHLLKYIRRHSDLGNRGLDLFGQ